MLSTEEELKPKKKRGRKKNPPLEPTEDFWAREDYIKRRTHWMWRLRPFLVKNNEQCKSCQMAGRCNRVPCNEEVTAKIAAGKECPDYKSLWKRILGKEEEYDWGF